jgi:hypothetical protein
VLVSNLLASSQLPQVASVCLLGSLHSLTHVLALNFVSSSHEPQPSSVDCPELQVPQVCSVALSARLHALVKPLHAASSVHSCWQFARSVQLEPLKTLAELA